MLKTPMDGFTLDPTIRYLPNRYTPGALGQMDVLRRANGYRPRWFLVPDDFNQPLAAYSTLEYQIQVAGGSYLWGLLFTQTNAAFVEVAPTSVVFQITEACNGLALFDDFVSGSAFSHFQAAALPRGMAPVQPLTQPRLFLEPGTVNVEMCNLGAVTVNCQLLLLFAEPITLITDNQAQQHPFGAMPGGWR